MLDEHYLTASSEESSSNAPTSYQPLFPGFISHKPYFWPLRPLAAAVISLLLYPKPSCVEEPRAALHWVHNASLCCRDIALQLVAHLPPCFQGTQHIHATPLPLADLKQWKLARKTVYAHRSKISLTHYHVKSMLWLLRLCFQDSKKGWEVIQFKSENCVCAQNFCCSQEILWSTHMSQRWTNRMPTGQVNAAEGTAAAGPAPCTPPCWQPRWRSKGFTGKQHRDLQVQITATACPSFHISHGSACRGLSEPPELRWDTGGPECLPESRAHLAHCR